MAKFIYSLFILLFSVSLYGNPIKDLLERIDVGASKKFIIEKIDSEKDFFELDQQKEKIIIRGNNYISLATGLNWYLKYYAGIHLSWNGMKASLPDILPPVSKKIKKETDMSLRYNLNYCTYSYTMAFWDWERWDKFTFSCYWNRSCMV